MDATLNYSSTVPPDIGTLILPSERKRRSLADHRSKSVYILKGLLRRVVEMSITEASRKDEKNGKISVWLWMHETACYKCG